MRRRARLALLGVIVAAAVAALLGSARNTSSAAQPLDPVGAARRYLAAQSGAAGASSADLAVVNYRETRVSRHVHFQRQINGLPVIDAYVSVSLRKSVDGVTMAAGDSPGALPSIDGPVRVTAEKAISIAQGATGVRQIDAVTSTASYFDNGPTALRAWDVRFTSNAPIGDWRVVVSAIDGSVLDRRNRIAFDSGQVFDPNPVVSSNDAIPPPTDCDDPANEPALSSEYTAKTLLGINSAQGKLVGQYVDMTAPGILGYKPAGQADEPTHVYIYPCNDDRFEEVMVYHHVDSTQRLLQSLGFTGLSSVHAFPVAAHAHYAQICGSFWTSAGLHFGDGCFYSGGVPVPMDNAEDADVIVHEYGHALQDDQVTGGLPYGSEGLGMAEGFADFVAAAKNGDPCMFEWAAALSNLFLNIPCEPALKDPDGGPVRTLFNNRHYPEGIHADPHLTGLIWGGALWTAVRDLGNDEPARMKVLTLAVQANFYLNAASDLQDATEALRQADIDLFGGADLAVLDNVLARRGLIAVTNATSDDDGDGCTNGREVGGNPAAGGLRNPLYLWDFYDTWTRPDPNGQPSLWIKDKVVSVPGDIFNVARRFGAMRPGGPPTEEQAHAEALVPPALPAGYDASSDRGSIVGPAVWDLNPPDGSINVPNDILGVARQFGHSCA